MLLAEYAITPDVFDTTSYSHVELCEVHMGHLKEVLLNEGLVRDLRAGEWQHLFGAGADRPWNRKAMELLRKLKTQKRLVSHHPALEACPSDDRSWCEEALATHEVTPLTGGIIVTESVKSAFGEDEIVARIDRLTSAPWWASRSPSVRLGRCAEEYLQQLNLVLRHANSMMFIDPHLDPAKRRYGGLTDLIAAAGNRTPKPVIEIHRVCYEGSGPSRQLLDSKDLETAFRRGLGSVAQTTGLRVEVFIWDDFHDRYLISDLVGISLPYGFDTTTNLEDRTTWTRLGRGERDDVQREFDPASRRHALRHRFTLG